MATDHRERSPRLRFINGPACCRSTVPDKCCLCIGSARYLRRQWDIDATRLFYKTVRKYDTRRLPCASSADGQGYRKASISAKALVQTARGQTPRPCAERVRSHSSTEEVMSTTMVMMTRHSSSPHISPRLQQQQSCRFQHGLSIVPM